MMRHGAFHPKSGADRLYRTKEKGGHGLIIWEGCILSKKNNLG